jgi:eukaryotic-like serine/threonine-protein kinase
MSKFELTEQTPDPRPRALAQSEVAAASQVHARSLVEDHRALWRRGEPMKVEAYLERFRPSGVDAALLLDLIYNEVVLREEDGDSPQLDEYLSRFPEHDEALRAQFDVHHFLRTSGSFVVTLAPTSIDSPAPPAGPPADKRATIPVHTTTEPDTRSRSASPAGPETDAPKLATDTVAQSPDPSWPRVDGFDILGVLGSGGMGTVYRAFDRKSRHTVALKTLNRVGAAALLRFKHEFRNLLDVAHPNLVTLYELISDGQNWYLTMELLDGVDFQRYVKADAPSRFDQETSSSWARGDLSDQETEVIPADEQARIGIEPATVTDSASALEPGSPPPPRGHVESPVTARPGYALTKGQRSRLRAALRQLAEGIAALHAAGKLHRDIKPSNVIVTKEGRVVLLDFGLAAEQGHDGHHRSTEEHVVGTAAYMAPEQAANPSVSAASDWYSVGVMLFEALTGRLPFVGNALSVLMDKQRFEPPAPSELTRGVPEDLNALCVDLLRRRPEQRPHGREVLRRLGNEGKTEDVSLANTGAHPSASTSAPGHRVTLVGRRRHREALEAALTDMRSGRTVAVYLHGPSGAGKTALLQNFLDQRLEQGDAVILAGRCYERESVPYKALDSLIDALGRHLGRLPAAEAAALLPRDVASLARVFPSLRRVKGVVESPSRGFASPDPQELRRRAFSALRELLARLGDRKPLVLAIDDLQWGDVDSAALLVELLRPPDAPVLLFLGTYRSEDRATSPFLQALFEAHGPVRDQNQVPSGGLGLDCRDLAVELLAHDDASSLALALLGEVAGSKSTDQRILVEAIARESSGNPFFVAELVRHVQADTREHLEPAGGHTADLGGRTETKKLVLDEVLWSRIVRLPDEARRVLELIAISGRPLRLVELGQCAELAQDERVALAVLRAGRLIRSTGRAETDEVETYHDRVRETVVSRLEPDTARSHHHRLAVVLEGSGQADPEVLGLHFLGAGLPERASEYFIEAADEAAEALAFERAAALYRRALEHHPRRSGKEWILRARLGDALASAGRGADAARAYLEAVAHATVAESLELQRRAAMQFLISGHIDEGLATLQTVLAAVDMTLPRTPLRSLASLLWRRARLRLRGLGFRERDPSEIAATDLTRIDVCWSAGVGLSVVDTIRGADFQARGLLLALEVGEASRIARSLAMEVAHRASTGGSNQKSSARLLKMAEDLAQKVDDPYASAMVTLARGVAAYLEGRWRDAREDCDRAETIFRDRCTGVAWELDTASAFGLWSLSHLGEVAELCRRWPILLTQARERGDLYAVMNLSSYLMSVVRLAANDPQTARAELRATMAQWSRQGYHVQHNDALWAGVQIELYCGDGQSAWNLIHQSWPALRRSLLLRVQFIRTSMNFLRARAALAAAVELKDSRQDEARRLLAVAARAARSLEREGMPCPSAYSHMIRAGLAALRGDTARAAILLAETVERFDAVEMGLCAASVRRRLGELIGGDRGAADVAHADQWMIDQKIENPAAMASMILPRLN